MLTHIISAQELEVEGNLKVTGTIQNDSLMLIISNLQAQIAALQAQLVAMQGAGNKLETRVYELPRYTWDSATSMNINMSEITGYDLDFAKVEITKVSDHYTDNQWGTTLRLQASYTRFGGEIWRGNNFTLQETPLGSVEYGKDGMAYVIYDGNNGIRINTDGYNLDGQGGDSSGWADIIISITAQFPE